MAHTAERPSAIPSFRRTESVKIRHPVIAAKLSPQSKATIPIDGESKTPQRNETMTKIQFPAAFIFWHNRSRTAEPYRGRQSQTALRLELMRIIRVIAGRAWLLRLVVPVFSWRIEVVPSDRPAGQGSAYTDRPDQE